MARFIERLLLASLCLSLSFAGIACAAHSDNANVRLADPIESTTLGPGDVFRMEIVGEKDLPQEYQIASDGTVDLPYLHSVKVSGLEPQGVVRLVRKLLMDRQVLTDPSVIVSVKEYNSKRVTVLGQVQKPGSFPLTPGLTLIQAISLAGGLNSIAAGEELNLTRKTKSGSKTAVISINAITDGRAQDIPLQAGDQIFVRERVF